MNTIYANYTPLVLPVCVIVLFSNNKTLKCMFVSFSCLCAHSIAHMSRLPLKNQIKDMEKNFIAALRGGGAKLLLQ